MQTIQLSILINAERQIVWDVLQHQLNSRERLAAFSINPLEDGNYILKQMPGGEKMLSQVVRHSPCDVFSIKHELMLCDGKADYWHPEIRNWVGLYEVYRLSEKGDQALLHIEADCASVYANWVCNQISKTLEEVKLLSEQMTAVIMSN